MFSNIKNDKGLETFLLYIHIIPNIKKVSKRMLLLLYVTHFPYIKNSININNFVV